MRQRAGPVKEFWWWSSLPFKKWLNLSAAGGIFRGIDAYILLPWVNGAKIFMTGPAVGEELSRERLEVKPGALMVVKIDDENGVLRTLDCLYSSGFDIKHVC